MLTRRSVLDVNVWLANFDDWRVHHKGELQLLKQPGLRIAHCPVSENAALRVLGMPCNFLVQLSFVRIQNTVAAACASLVHRFWPVATSLRQGHNVNWARVACHNAITDAHLLGLGAKHGATLSTVNHHVAPSSIHGANADHLLLL